MQVPGGRLIPLNRFQVEPGADRVGADATDVDERTEASEANPIKRAYSYFLGTYRLYGA